MNFQSPNYSPRCPKKGLVYISLLVLQLSNEEASRLPDSLNMSKYTAVSGSCTKIVVIFLCSKSAGKSRQSLIGPAGRLRSLELLVWSSLDNLTKRASFSRCLQSTSIRQMMVPGPPIQRLHSDTITSLAQWHSLKD